MKLSFNSWLYGSAFGWMPTRSLEDTVDTLAEIGYDGIEIGAAAPHGYPAFLSADRRQEINRHLESRGLEVSALCPALGGSHGYNPAAPEKEEREANFQYIKECCELAHDLNCENVIWLAGWTRYGQVRSDAWAYAVEALQRCAEVSQPLGVKLVVEPTSEVSDVIDHAGDTLRLIDDAGVDPEWPGSCWTRSTSSTAATTSALSCARPGIAWATSTSPTSAARLPGRTPTFAVSWTSAS